MASVNDTRARAEHYHEVDLKEQSTQRVSCALLRCWGYGCALRAGIFIWSKFPQGFSFSLYDFLTE